jgi:hypothetical protein
VTAHVYATSVKVSAQPPRIERIERCGHRNGQINDVTIHTEKFSKLSNNNCSAHDMQGKQVPRKADISSFEAALERWPEKQEKQFKRI